MHIKWALLKLSIAAFILFLLYSLADVDKPSATSSDKFDQTFKRY